MLTPDELTTLCQRLALSEQAQKTLALIRSSLPAAVLAAVGKMFPFAIPAGKWGSSFKQKAAWWNSQESI